jgi:hypothetical protein
MVDVGSHLDELRSWPTERLHAQHEALTLEVRGLQLEDLDVLRVLDERGEIDVSVGRDGESARTVREKLETARALESLPAIAASAHELRKWWNREHTKLRFNGELPGRARCRVRSDDRQAGRGDEARTGRALGEVRGAADALIQMCDAVEVAEGVETPQLAPRPLFCVDVPPKGPVEIAGIPMADAMVERLRAEAKVEPVLVDADRAPRAVGRISSSRSPKIVRAVLLRDGHCRCSNCDLRYGLHVHHLRPRSWGGTDELSNLAMVASVHHPMLIPHGPCALVGDPNRPDGLRMKHVGDLTPEEAAQVGLPRPRARPGAA